MLLYYDKRMEIVNFGMEQIKKALDKRNIKFYEKSIFEYNLDTSNLNLVVQINKKLAKDFYQDVKLHKDLTSEGFQIEKINNTIFLKGYDLNGVLYGLLDLAETILYYGIEGIENKIENPFQEFRGIKFNLPFEPYDTGDCFTKNISTCLDKTFWKKLIDFLALNRYNALSLWSENPFNMMFRLDKYPDTTPYTDIELERYTSVYKYIFKYAKERGLKTYLITWNIRIDETIAKGLGLPKELGEMNDRYDVIRNESVAIPSNIRESDSIRQRQEIISDYFKECVKTLLIKYKDLSGLGTSSSEEMSGTIEDKVDWIYNSYLKGVEESGRQVPFIFRMNESSAELINEKFLNKYTNGEKYISWKYSVAHMYSSTNPQFEKNLKAWEQIELDKTNVIYTVRNDDFHTFRGGSMKFLKEYIINTKKDYVKGFYWGADGYLFGKDFQHVPHKHMDWEYDFEKHWYQFELIGRLAYNPYLNDDIWTQKFKSKYNSKVSEHLRHCYNNGTEILPPLQRMLWFDYDYEWHPECLVSTSGFKSVIDFMKGRSMPGEKTLSIYETAKKILEKSKIEEESAIDVIKQIEVSCQNLENHLNEIKLSQIDDLKNDGELACTLLDMECWLMLGRYYLTKINSALSLSLFDLTSIEKYREEAIEYATQGVPYWNKLSELWSSHYLPYKLTRSKYYFGFTYYLDDVLKDIELCKNYKHF